MFPNIDRGKFKPPSDVIASDDRFIVLVEIASMQADAFKLTLVKRKLVVTGTRQLSDHCSDNSYHQVEIGTGEFRLEFSLPKPVDDTQVTASYQNGLLRIELPFLPLQPVKVTARQEKEPDNQE